MLGTIVLADDSKTVRRMVEIALHKHPFQLEVATNGAQTLDLVRGRNPAVVLVDTNLPGDGYLLVSARGRVRWWRIIRPFRRVSTNSSLLRLSSPRTGSTSATSGTSTVTRVLPPW